MKKIVFILFAALIVASFIIGSGWFKKSSNSPQGAVAGSNVPPESFAALNGKLVAREVSERRPVAVMVENHPDARPQAGLSGADVVYEALAEGGITRFMAVYQTNMPESVGPIRSAREYYAQLADEIGALYAHVGGSNEVIDQIKRGVYKNLDDANEYYNENFFKRVTFRSAPHNVYTSIAKLYDLAKAHAYDAHAAYESWKFKDDGPVAGPEHDTAAANYVYLDFSLSGYEVEYYFDRERNEYRRSLAGKPQLDADNSQQLIAKNVIVQFVDVTPVAGDKLLSVDVDLKSGGKALVFLDGKAIEGRWKKTATGRTRFYDEYDQEIALNRGTTWVELVPADKESSSHWEWK